MLPTSIPQTSPLAPIQRMSVGPNAVDAVRRFNDDSTDLYNKFSPFDGSSDGIGFRQPYVWTGLNDSNIAKYIKLYDTQTNPVGSVSQDIQRLTQFMSSGFGKIYSNVQFALQGQNAFNETRVWDQSSILNATGREALIGDDTPYPIRHIDSSGGVLNTLASGFLSSVGISSQLLNSNMPPEGTATAGLAALSQEVQAGGGDPAKGFVRYQTAATAEVNFTNKFGSSTGNGSAGFLQSLGDSLISSLSSLIPTTNGGTANWKYRVEYSDDSDVFSSYLSDPQNLLGYSIVSGMPGYLAKDVHRFYPGDNSTETDNWYYGASQQGNSFSSEIDDMISDLAAGDFDINNNYTVDKANQIKKLPRDASTTTTTDLTKILGDTTMTRITAAVSKWNSNPTYQAAAQFYTSRVLSYSDLDSSTKSTTSRKTGDNQTLTAKGFAGAGQNDLYNSLSPIQATDSTIPPDLLDASGVGSKDTIFFYFIDLVNNIYVPFRATLNSINENTSVEWEEVQYMGRADKLYMYKGFTRELNFGFTVVANSVAELAPMWRRINYLSGLTRPSKYTQDGSGTSLGQFIFPPMIKFRIGDLFVDQPAIIRSYGMVIPEDALWETTVANSDYQYLVENGTAKITSTYPVAQVPMKADIIISMALIEKERSLTKNLRYFDNTGAMDSFTNNQSLTTAQSAFIQNASSTFNSNIDTSNSSIQPSTTTSLAGASAGSSVDTLTSSPDFTSGQNLPVAPAPLPTFGPGP